MNRLCTVGVLGQGLEEQRGSGRAPLYLSVLRATVQDTENRICRLLFKQSVELDMVMNVLTAMGGIMIEQMLLLEEISAKPNP